MNSLEEILAKLQGRDPEAEAEKKKKSDAAVAEHEQVTGEKFQDEPGIEPDEVTEGAVMLPFGGPASGMAKRAGGFAVKQAGKAAAKNAVQKLEESGPPRPVFHEGVSTGQTGSGPSKFSQWVKGESEQVSPGAAKSAAPSAQKEVLNTPRFGTSERVKALQEERNTLNLNTPAGRDRLKEIDSMLSNRTYFKE